MTSLSPFSVSSRLSSSDTSHVISAAPFVPRSTAVPSVTITKPKQKPRKRINTAEKRHQHNAVERQRRETLNTKFIDLARLLPSLAAHRRPSKSAIVNGSISHLNYQRTQRLLAAKLLRAFAVERDAMIREINQWRQSNGFELHDTSPSWTDEMQEVCNVEQETFGNFNNVGGDDGDDDDDNEGSADTYSVPSRSDSATNTQQNGRITPRHSTEINTIPQAQVLFGSMPLPASRCPTAAPMNQNWSNEFAYSVSNTQTGNAYPYNPFMSESVDHSATDSPTASAHGVVLTPPGFSEMSQHTPSPPASNGMAVGMEEVKPIVYQHHQPQHHQAWTPAHIHIAHQQALFHGQHHHAPHHAHAQAYDGQFTPPVTNVDPNVFGQHFAADMHGNMDHIVPAPEQIDQWRRANSTLVHDPRNVARLSLDSVGGWASTSDRDAESY